jgi:hypothetical protein
MEISIGGSSAEWTQIVTAWAALVAALLGPCAGYLAARHQAHRSVVSVNRQRWVDELRDELALFFVACAGLGQEANPNHPFRSIDPRSAVRSHMTELDRLKSTIELRLNPNEPDHKLLLEQLQDCVDAAINDTAYPRAKETALKTAKRVLKKEWEAVKSGS